MKFGCLNDRIRIILTVAVWFVVSTLCKGQDYLIGFTQYGGAYNKGVPYQINTDGSGFISYTDLNGTTGEKPGDGAAFTQYYYPIVSSSGEPFAFSGTSGLTQLGDQGLGARININPGEGGFAAPSGFHFGTGSTGTNPGGRFLMGFDMTLFGMTSAQGYYGNGAVFTTSAIVGGAGSKAVFSFDGTNGKSPKGSLIMASDGRVYGMTELGGTNNLGVIFSCGILPFTDPFRKLLDFDGAVKGSNPTGNLLLASDGRLYGMTRTGGANGNGVIFSIAKDGSGYIKLMDFNGPASGGNPKGSLTEFTDGKLYGLTSSGGASGYGTIFSITPSGTFTKILDFNGTNGKSPVGDLLVSTNGTALYGVTYAGGANNVGVLFKLDNGSQFTKLYDYSLATGSNPVGSLMMKKKIPEITFPAVSLKTTLSEPFATGVTSTADLPIYYISSNPLVAVVENNQIKIKGAGSTKITAFHLGNHEFLAQTATQDVYVKLSTQTITFDPIPSKIFGDPSFTIRATSSSGLPVTFSMYYNSSASNVGNVVSITGAGTVTIRANQSGDATYDAAPEVTQTLTIERATQKVSFTPNPTIVCCQPFSLSATASSRLGVSFKTLDWETIRIDEYQNVPVGVGTAEIIAYQEGNANYKPAEARASVTVLKGLQYINFSIYNGPFKFGDQPGYVASNSSSGLPVTYTSNPPGIAVVDGASLHILGVGTTTITATQAGNNLYSPAASVTATVKVDPPATPPTGNVITWADPYPKTMVDPPFNLFASASSGLPVSYTSSDPSVATVSGNLVTIKGVGSTTLTATQTGNTKTPAAQSVQKILQVTKRSQYLYFSLDSYATFGGMPISLPPTTYDGLPITYTSSANNIASIEDYFLLLKDAGTVTITASQPGNSQFMPAQSMSQTITIAALGQSITFKDLPAKTYGDLPFDLDVKASSGMPVTFTSSDPQIATIAGSTVTILRAGTVKITAVQSGMPGYYRAEMSKQLVVNKKSQTLSFAALGAKKFGDVPFTISATSSANLPVEFSSAKPAVAKVSGNVVTITGNGQADIMATQAGNENYLAAETVHQQFQVSDVGNTYAIAGAASGGGPNGSGIVYSMNSDGDNFTIVKQFASRTAPVPVGGFIKGMDGKMYGTFFFGGRGNGGQIIRLEADGTGYTVLHDLVSVDGQLPYANLMQASNGDLYGTTSTGGANKVGTIFKIKPDGTGFTVVHNYKGLQASSPIGGLLQAADGKLYGMTRYGGFYGMGAIYSINTDGSAFTVLFSLNNGVPFVSGSSPTGELVQGSDGFLYGSLSAGGANNKGTLFKIKTDGSNFTKLIDFDGATFGAFPGPTLRIASDGKIYGVSGGGANNIGTIFSIHTDGSNFKRLYDFDANDGSYPVGKLTEGTDGLLYGMAKAGGVNALGTAFSIHKDGTGFHKLIDFDGRANTPVAGSLLESTPGLFFGMTQQGGAINAGAIFSLASDGRFAVVKDFPQQESNPQTLISDAAGEYYFGIVFSGSVSANATVFRTSATGTSYQRILDLPEGSTINSLFYISTGHVWGIARQNGASFIFRMKPDGSEYQRVVDFDKSIQKGSGATWLVESSDGYVYGLGAGGANNNGLAFKIKNDGTSFSKILDLPAQPVASPGRFMQASDGNFYGFTSNYTSANIDYLIRFDASGSFTNVLKLPADIVGDTPGAIVEMNGGSLGVVTKWRGSLSAGTVFTVEKDGSSLTKIYDSKSSNAISMQQTMDGWIYVACAYGGVPDKGTVYKIRGDGSSFTKVRDFNGDDGAMPTAMFFRKEAQTFTFNALPEKKTSDAAFVPQAVSSSGAPVQLVSSNPLVAIVENGKIKPVGVGTTIITASLPASSNFYKADEKERQLVVVRGSQTITFDAPAPVNKDDVPFQLRATASSGLTLTFKSSNSAVAVVEGTTVTIKGIGTTTLTASQAGDSNFFPAESVQQTLVVKNGGAQRIQLTIPASIPLTNGTFNISAVASSGLPVTFATSSDKISVNGTNVTLLKAGVASIVATQAGDTDFLPAPPVEVFFCIAPPKPQITISGVAPDFLLQSSNNNGNQWYLNEFILPGATQNSFSATLEGAYTVVTTIEGCASESAPKAIVTTGLEQEAMALIELFPNPASHAVTVAIGGTFKQPATLELIDGTGRSMSHKQMSEPGTIVFDLQNAPAGLYLLKIELNGNVLFRKLLKE